MSRLSDFQERIHQVIPLTSAMVAKPVVYDGQLLLVQAPLEPNRNHQGTGFGGSVYSVAVLAAWGLIELVVEDAGVAGNVVIQSGQMDYSRPVDSDFYALCRLPGEQERQRFLTILQRRGRARLALSSRVYCGEPTTTPSGEPVAVFEGRFVVRAVPAG